MSVVTVTTEQVRELIQQLAAQTVAASITPEMVANIFEKMRQLNDQEKDKIIVITQAYLQELNQAGIVGFISRETTQSEEDDVVYETDEGNVVGTVGPDGADFINLKRGGQQVARMSDLPTKDSSINENPSTTNVPTTKAVKDYVDAHSGGDYPIDTESTSSDTEEQVWGNNTETQEYAKIGSYGMKSKAYLDMQGDSIIDDEISDNPSTTHAPSAKAVADYVEEHGGGVGDLPISQNSTQSEDEEQVWGNDEGTREYMKVGNYGVKAKAYLDMNGNPIINNQVMEIHVKKDGSGDFTDVVSAITSIQSTNTIPCNIYIHEGEYDMVTDWFNHVGVSYNSPTLTQTQGQGVVLPPLVNLIGAGKREDIILKGELPSDATLKVSIYFSTINMRGYDNSIENLTITCFNGRYAIHDQVGSECRSVYIHNFRNLSLIHKGYDAGATQAWTVDSSNNDSSHRWGSCHPLGQGTSNTAYINSEYVDFYCNNTHGSAFLTHDANNAANHGGSHIKFNCCCFRNDSRLMIDISSIGADCDNTVEVNNCKFVAGTDLTPLINGAISSSSISGEFVYWLYGNKTASDLVVYLPNGYDSNNNII